MNTLSIPLFDDASAWLPVASGQVELNLARVRIKERPALRMEYDFRGGGGFAVARREWRQAMPEAFEIKLRAAGRGSVNHLEVKLVDPSNQNVWRYQVKDFRASAQGRVLRIPSQLVEFAWGPAGGGAIAELGAIEIAVVAGEGGRGTWTVSDFSLEDLSFTKSPKVSASSSEHGHAPSNALRDDAGGWKPSASDAKPWIVLDAGAERVLGGLTIDWLESAPIKGFRVQTSDDGVRWRSRYQTHRAGGKRSDIYLPKTTARFLRVEMHSAEGIRKLTVQSFEFSRSLSAFWHQVAQREPRGHYPRWLLREQSLWTPIGMLEGTSCGLMNEQGLVEPSEASFTLEPFLSLDGEFLTWADVQVTQHLKQNWMPIPSVVWKGNDWSLTIEAFSANGVVSVRYWLETTRKAPSVRLYVAIRPFQVTPTWQHFRNVGGLSPIHEFGWDGQAILVNGTQRLWPTAPAAFGAMTFAEGNVVEQLAAGGKLPNHVRVKDKFGFATGVLCFEGMEAGVDFALKNEAHPNVSATETLWQNKFPAAQITAAGWGRDAILAMRTAAAHVLSTRSGPALQPGPRRYTRSWIRDGTIMSAALLRLGCVDEVRDFISWYEPFIREDGFVPCCVDRDGPDWLVEHDSHGQWLALIEDYYAFTKDDDWLKARWPIVQRVVANIERLLSEDGLMPVSVSHEGYLAHPVHSYWDDFWTVRGLQDAAELATVMGKPRLAKRWHQSASTLAKALYASIETTRAAKDLNFIPASVEWADFDPTATANALSLLDAPVELNATALQHTFSSYFSDWRKKRTGELAWANYTPYEIRIIGAFVRLKQRETALELLQFFLTDRRPLAWNQWPEIAWRDPMSPAHIGDVPHTWIGAEYILAVQSLFAYENPSERTLVLAAGLDAAWLEGDGVSVSSLPTPHGLLNYSLRRSARNTLDFTLLAGLTLPVNGIILRPPLPGKILQVEIKPDQKMSFTHDAVTVAQTSIQLRIIHD